MGTAVLRVRRMADMTIVSGQNFGFVSFDTIDIDTHGVFSLGNPTALGVPGSMGLLTPRVFIYTASAEFVVPMLTAGELFLWAIYIVGRNALQNGSFAPRAAAIGIVTQGSDVTIVKATVHEIAYGSGSNSDLNGRFLRIAAIHHGVGGNDIFENRTIQKISFTAAAIDNQFAFCPVP